MNYHEIRLKLKKHNLEVFTTQEFINIFGMSRTVAATKLTRYKRAGYLTSPRRGVYYFSNEVDDKFKVANKLYYPSYISLDSALSKYGLIPETVYTITSVTTKATREFIDTETVYRYYRIKKQAFTGYRKEGDTLWADPEKAIVDYLYFVSQGKRTLNDRQQITKIDKKKVLFYADLYNNERLDKIIKNIFS